MADSISATATRQEARKLVSQLARPKSIGKAQWRGVHTLLRVIANHYPRAYPSEERLATKTGYSLRSIRRYVATAKKAGLLSVTPDAGAKGVNHSWSKTNQYHINTTSQAVPTPTSTDKTVPNIPSRPIPQLTSPIGAKLACMNEASLASKEVLLLRSTPSLAPTEQTTSAPLVACSAPSGPKRSNVTLMAEWKEQSRDIGSATSVSRPPKLAGTQYPSAESVTATVPQHRGNSKPRPRSLPARRLVEHFLQRWDNVIADSRPEYRAVRPLESIGQAARYFKVTFLEGTPVRTEDEVRKTIDEFIQAIAKGDIRIKKGQSAWMRFTGSWGRQQRVEVVDPYAMWRDEA